MNAKVEAASIALRDELEKPDRSLTLYELVDALNAIDEQLDESGGELTPEIETALSSLGGAFDAKLDSICSLRQNVLATATMLQGEIERLTKRAEMFRRKAESLRHYLHGAFIQTGKDKVKTARFTVYTQSNPPSVRWTKPLEILPTEYQRVTVEVNASKAIHDHKAGMKLPEGFEIVRGQHLRIT